MNKILIVEDEVLASQHLQKAIAEVMPEAEVIGVLQSIEETVEYFAQADPSSAQYPQLVFLDIHLADGLSFRIFEQVKLECPVIFTTAYDQYALDAFRVNAIDYLLKPINPDDLRRATAKLAHFGAPQQSNLSPEVINRLLTDLKQNSQSHYRSSFLIPVRDKLIPLQVKDIACIYLEDKISRAILRSGQQQIIDRPLDNIYADLNPDLFFRANRQYIIARSSIKEISMWPISKLAITLEVPTPEKIIISKAKVSEFKQWYTN